MVSGEIDPRARHERGEPGDKILGEIQLPNWSGRLWGVDLDCLLRHSSSQGLLRWLSRTSRSSIGHYCFFQQPGLHSHIMTFGNTGLPGATHSLEAIN